MQGLKENMCTVGYYVRTSTLGVYRAGLDSSLLIDCSCTKREGPRTKKSTKRKKQTKEYRPRYVHEGIALPVGA
jgi:hypothetical protein